MNKKSFLLCGIAAVLAIGGAGTLLAANNFKSKFDSANAGPQRFGMVADAEEFASLSTTYTRGQTFSVSSGTGYSVSLNVVNGKKDGDNLVLGKAGEVFNFGASSANNYSAITNIWTVTVKFTGDLSIQYATRSDGMELGPKVALESEGGCNPGVEGANFFKLTTVGGATIESITIQYVCNQEAYTDIGWMNGTSWTAKDGSGTTYKLTCGDGTFSLASLDLETNVAFNGTYSRNYETGKIDAVIDASGLYPGATVTMVFQDDNAHSKMTFVSKTDSVGGALVSYFASLSFNRVYMVEDFESYTTTGVGYTANNAESNRSGLQGAYIADYYDGGNTSPVGTSGFQLMGSTDFLELDTTYKYEGNNAGKFKASNGKWMRYWQYDQLVGEPYEAGRGAYISMMVKNRYSSIVQMKWGSMYSYSALNDTTRNYGDFATVNIPANQDWTEYRVPLTKTSYGWYVGFNNANSTAYIDIDNVCIYTDSPYVEYEAPVTVPAVLENTYKSSAHVDAISADYSYIIALGNGGAANVKVGGQDAGATGYTYDNATHKVTITTTGSLAVEQLGGATFAYGDIEGTYNESTGEIENISFKGAIGTYITNNGTMKATRGSLELRCDGDDAELREIFRSRYDNGSGWGWDDSNTDRIKSNTTSMAQGTGSVKFRYLGDGNSNHKSALALKNDVEIAGAKDLSFWCLNDTGADFTIRLFVYKAANMGSNVEIANVVVPASTEWAFFQVGLGDTFSSASLRNFQFFVASTPSANFYPSFDNIVIF